MRSAAARALCLLILALLLMSPSAARAAWVEDALRHAVGPVALHVETDLDALAADLLESGLPALPGMEGAVPVLERVRALGKGRASGIALAVLGCERDGAIEFVGVFDAGAGLEALRAIFSGAPVQPADLEFEGRKGLLIASPQGEMVIVPGQGKRTFVMGRRDAVSRALEAARKPAKEKAPMADLRAALPKGGRAEAFSLAASFTPALRAAAKGAQLPEALLGFGLAVAGDAVAIRFETARPEDAAALAQELKGAAKLAEGVGGLAPNDPAYAYARMAAEVGRKAKIEAKGRAVHVAATLDGPVLKSVAGALSGASAAPAGGSPETNRHVCESARRVLDGAGDLCRLDHPDRKADAITVDALLKDGYLKAKPVCPDGGTYAPTVDGETITWRCSKHAGK